LLNEAFPSNSFVAACRKNALTASQMRWHMTASDFVTFSLALAMRSTESRPHDEEATIERWGRARDDKQPTELDH